jgi:outer membrane protein OmpA-like peptidoglycan-associated protein
MKYLTFFAVLLFSISLTAQQQSSKSKSSDKLYEKGELKRSAILHNATGVNTVNLDFSPTFYENGIVYVSSRYKSGPVDRKIGETFFELFYAELDANDLPQRPRDFSLTVNSQAHEGPVSFSRDGNFIYFTRNNLEKGISKANAEGKVVMKIYEARRGKTDWQNVVELPFNSDNYTCVHPSLSADGRRLFFSSDMPGGYGGMDLYYVEKKEDRWSKPINLGADLNTPGNEVFPFLHESGTLFFSSNGHGGEGGLDILLIDISSNVWGKLANLGIPFNSAMDDLGFIINEEGTRGYFASDRPGGYGKDDIYMFEADLSLIEKEVPGISTMIIAYNALNNERLPMAGIYLFKRSEDGFIEGNGLYDVQLMPAQNGELVMKMVRKNTKDIGKPEFITNSNGEALCEMKRDKNYLLLVSKEGFETAEVNHSTTGETAAQTIRVALKPKTCVSLAGAVIAENYNTKVPNAQVRIVNETTGTEDLLQTGSNGDFDFCLPAASDFTIHAEKEGYAKGVTKLSTVGTSNSQTLDVLIRLQPVSEKIMTEPIKEGSIIVLENIYYDFNEFFIRRGAARELDALAQLMLTYPSMEVELIAHTDSRGSEKYNLDLSLNRAESAQRYLIQKGVAESRIRAFGYGESQIRNHCKEGVECTDEEHQYNRRTEVKIARIDEPVKVEYQEGNPYDRGGRQ